MQRGLIDMDVQSVCHCPHCSNSAPQILKGNCTHLHNPDGAHNFFLTQCQTCAEALLYRHIDPRNSGPEVSHGRFDLTQYELVWPKFRELQECVPITVRRIYAEAISIKSRAPNAFANQIRRALEAICKDRGATSRTLAQSLNELTHRGEACIACPARCCACPCFNNGVSYLYTWIKEFIG